MHKWYLKRSRTVDLGKPEDTESQSVKIRFRFKNSLIQSKEDFTINKNKK